MLVLCVCSVGRASAAQSILVKGLVQIGSEADERMRLSQLIDSANSAGYLARSASTMSSIQNRSKGFTLAVLAPELLRVSNSALPYSLNDGPMWAGRGTNVLYTAGLELRVRWVHLIAAPQVTTSQNQGFQVIPTSQQEDGARSIWANPFHPAESSIDLPSRFGDRPIQRTEAGQSSLTVDLPRVSVGVGTESMWWGPGQQNAILLSNNAPGFPHAFIRTRDGLTSRLGRFDAEWMLGRLNESPYFDFDTTNNVRSLNGLLVEWTPTPASGVHLGIARTVFTPLMNGRQPVARAFDAVRNIGNPNTSAVDSAKGSGPDQITGLFARWVVPAAHVESYAEWARFEQPKSVRDLLEFPGHSQGYTLGLQWARPMAGNRLFRLGGEVTYLEPDASIRLRPVATTYTSRSVAQGYTNRGQSLGAAIGPGSSSQWLTADFFDPVFRIGAFVSRVRWDNATVWLPIVPQVKNEDVTLLMGTRASITWKKTRVQLQYSDAVRLDYLYQDKIADPDKGTHAGVDIRNRTLSITVSTAVGR